jgi:MoxR-like ATPase
MDRFMSENPFDTLQTVCDTDHIKTMQEAVREVFVHPCVKEYIADMILATRNNSRIQVGASSRGTVGLLRLSHMLLWRAEPLSVRMTSGIWHRMFWHIV